MTKFLIFCSCLLVLTQLNAQHPNVLISKENKPNEPTIIFDKNHPETMVAAANINNYFISNDSGLTWEIKKQKSRYGVWGDPVLIVDTTGSFYYFHLSNPADGSWIDRIVCQRSDNQGQSWTDGTYTGLDGTKAQDKEWAVVNDKTNEIYLTWTQFDKYGSDAVEDSSSIMFSKSVDKGETWTKALRINETNGDCVDSDDTVEGAVPAVGPNGEIYVSWAGPEGLVFDRSMDGGESWLENDIKVTEIIGGWNYTIPGIMRCNGLPITKCDLSGGPNHGTIYISWSDQSRGDDDTDVWIVKSKDNGDTWTKPCRINDDSYGKHQFFSWIDIDQTNGNLFSVFYDRRNYEDEQTDVYMASSVDGGETFYNFKISESPFLAGSNTVFFGDYTNVIVHDNIIRPIWTRLDDKQLSVWTAIIDPQKAYLVSSSDVSVAELHEVTWKNCKSKQTKVVLFDHHLEKELILEDWKTYPKGKNNLSLNLGNFELESGSYEVRIYAKNKKRYMRRKIKLTRD